jgi:hypothetical protein
LNQIERLAAANFSEHDAVRAEAQRGLEQISNGDAPLAAGVCGAGLEPDHVLLLKLELTRVLDHDDALARGHERRESVQHRRLAAPGAPCDDDVPLAFDECAQGFGRVGGQRAELEELREREAILRKAPDGDRRAVWRDGRQKRLHTRAVGESCLEDGVRLVERTADILGDHAEPGEQLVG